MDEWLPEASGEERGGVLTKGYGVSFTGMKNVLKWTVVMFAHTYNVAKSIELYS